MINQSLAACLEQITPGVRYCYSMPGDSLQLAVEQMGSDTDAFERVKKALFRLLELPQEDLLSSVSDKGKPYLSNAINAVTEAKLTQESSQSIVILSLSTALCFLDKLTNKDCIKIVMAFEKELMHEGIKA